MPKPEPLPTLTDRDLVEAVVINGDELAFRELYRRHTPRLYQLVLRLVESEHDAEDIVQEAWIRATEAAANFRWESGFRHMAHGHRDQPVQGNAEKTESLALG